MASTFQIGETVTLNGKQYRIIGTKARSFLLERDGKRYKATADKMSKIQAQNARPVQSELERRVAYDRIFNPSAKAPETEAEIMDWFERLRNDLSPENLTCDGECSRGQVTARLREIRSCWRELEAKLGRKVAE